MQFKIGDRIQYTDEDGFKLPEMVIEEFRMTEVVARTDGGQEYRLDPKDFFNGTITKVE